MDSNGAAPEILLPDSSFDVKKDPLLASRRLETSDGDQ